MVLKPLCKHFGKLLPYLVIVYQVIEIIKDNCVCYGELKCLFHVVGWSCAHMVLETIVQTFGKLVLHLVTVYY